MEAGLSLADDRRTHTSSTRPPVARSSTTRFLIANGLIALGGCVLLHLLIILGCDGTVANAVQAVVTLELNFSVGLAYTWRHQIRDVPAQLGRRWWRFHVGRGGSMVMSIALFPVLAGQFGATAAFLGLLALGAVLNFVLDQRWAFAPTTLAPATLGMGRRR